MAERRIADRYEPVEELGRGGQATVVKAIDTRHGRLVALKVRAAPNGATEELLLEARALLSLPSHPGLAHARDDLFDAGRHVLVLDWVDGVDLAQVLAARGRPGLPVSSVLRWAAQAAEALSLLHRHGVVHGDVKPANLILDREGRVVLVDLGSSSVPDGTGPGTGTPGFRAPEVSAGSVPTAASDVYSLAASVFALLTGGPPTGALPVWAGIDPDVATRLEAAVRAGLAIDPARRPPTPGALVERLRAGWHDSTPTGVATVLLAEVMNASALWERDPNEAPELFAALQLTFDRCAEAHHGRRIGEVDPTDPGSMASAFANAVDAVSAAVDLQRELRGAHARLPVRVGMATGGPVLDGGDIRGPVVSRAVAVRERARAGEVLASETTAEIIRLGLPSEIGLLRLGPHRLNELDSTDDVVAVVADGVVTPPDPTHSPYQGLVPYDLADAESFFGRDAELAECLRRLADGGALVVVGPSGSGKSSLVRAGVAAALERDGRRVVVITPGAHPMSTLADASVSLPGTVLVVDQCEEATTVCLDVSERSRFFAALADHAGPLVVALRADRLGDVSAHAEFAAVVERGLYLLTSMDETGVREAIEGPARRAGLLLEPGLVDLLVRDVEGEPGALPMLSHALLQTWAHREGRSLTVAGYRASGGIRGAVAQSAELVYEQASPGQRTVVRDLMLRLVTPNPEGEPVRSRIPRRFVATDTDHEQVIELLVGARLVTSDEEMVELAHEALARAWPRLRAWLDDDADGQRILRHLSLAADTWDAMGRPDAELYRGVRLTRAMEWRERATPHLNAAEREFLDASQRHADSQREAARRRRRAVTTALVAGVVVTATLAAFALVNQRRADQEADRANEQAERANAEAARASEEARRADQEADRARSQALAASAVSTLTEDPSLAKLLAVASATVAEPTVETVATLHRAWAADRVTARPGPTYDLSVHAADIDPSGRRMAVAGAAVAEGSSKAVDVVDLATDTTAWKFELDETSGWVVSPRFTTDGEQVVAGVFWDPYNRDRVPTIERGGTIEPPPPDLVGIRVWDAETGDQVEQYDVGRCGGYPWAISDTHVLVRTLHGSAEAVAACDWRYGTLGSELVDRRTGERRLLSQNSVFGLRGTAMSDDGTTVAYDDVGGQHQVVVATTSTGQPTLRFTPALGQDSGVRGLNDDGTLLLYGDQPIQVWDVAAGEQVASFDGHQGGSRYATFVPGTQTVLSTGADGTMREWDAETGREIRVYPGIAEGPVSATRDGLVLTIGQSGSNEAPAALIDTGAHGELGAVETCPGSVAADSLRLTGALAVFTTTCVGDPTSTTYVIDWEAGRVLVALPGGRGGALAISPDGSRFVRQEGEGTRYGPLTVRDLRTGAEIIELEGLCTWDASSPVPPGQQEGCATSPEEPFAVRASRLKWSPDGTMIAAAAGTTVVVWDADTGGLLHTDAPDPDRISVADLIFSPDSALLFDASNDSRYRAVSTSSWQVLNIGEGSDSLSLIGFSADGTQLLVATQLMIHTGGSLIWFDVASEQVALTKNGVHEGSLRSVALSPDGALVATAASDGLVRVWDGATLELVHEVPLGETQIEGVAFVDDRRLAVTPQDGNLLLVTIDPGELLEIVRRSLTRGFTTSECTRFGFGDECPSLAELRGRPDNADDPAGLNGSYQVRWTAEEFETALVAAGEPKIAGRSTADGYPGTYTVTFHDGRFDIVHDAIGVFCTGSYHVTGDQVRLVAERREVPIGCLPSRLLDATFELTEDALTFHARAAHPVDAVLFASRRLTRVEN